MEDFNNLDRSKDTSEYSSDESEYFSASGSPILPPFEEFNNPSYLSESDHSSIYSGIYEPDIGQVNPTTYPATANFIEVLGIFPVEVRGTTYYQPLFYYVPVYNDTDFSSSDSDAYYTAQESQSYFESDESDYEAEEFGYFSETNVETTSFESFEFSPDDDFDLSENKEYLESESPIDNYEKEGRDNIELHNESDSSSTDFGSNNIDKHRPSYIGDINERDNFSETNVETASFESFEFSPNDDFDIREDKEYLASERPKDNYKEEVRDNIELQNESKCTSAADIGSNKIDKHRPSYIEDINERNNFSGEWPINAFDFEGVNSKNCENHGLKKYNSLDDLSGKKQGQSLKKHKSLENLSQIEDNEIYEKDYQFENREIRMGNYDQNKKSLSSDPDDFEEDLTEEEIQYAKDQIYLRALSGKLYQKTHIPSVAILPTIYEENECFDETDEELLDLETSRLNGNQALLNGSLCNLFEPSDENEEIFEKSQQKPKKKKMKRLREFLARMFCCVKPP